MEKFSLDAIAREQVRRAAASSSGRSSATVYSGHEHTLRQTVIALTAGAVLDDHENPGEATVQDFTLVKLRLVRPFGFLGSWSSARNS